MYRMVRDYFAFFISPVLSNDVGFFGERKKILKTENDAPTAKGLNNNYMLLLR